MKLKDWQGNEYGPGDRVVYVNGSSYGNSWTPGVVVDITETQPPETFPARVINGDTYPSYTRPGKYLIKFLAEDSKTGKVSRLSNLSKIMKL